MKKFLPAILWSTLYFSISNASFASLLPNNQLVEDQSTGFSVQAGFEVDLVYKVDNSKYGSWIAMAFDHKGRLVVSDQDKAGTLSSIYLLLEKLCRKA